MKKLSVRLISVFFILLLISSCAPSGQMAKPSPALDAIMERNELVVGTAGSMPPLNMTMKDGLIQGIDMDLARMMAGALDVELNIQTMPFADLLPALEAGKVDMVISGMTITPERNMKVAFAGPYMVSGKAFLTKFSSLAAIEDPTALNTEKYAFTALKGSTSEILVKELMPRAKLMPAKDYNEAVKLVLEDKADAMVADYQICVVSLLRHKGKGLVSVISPFTYEPLGIALPAGDPQLINWTKNFLNLAIESGEMERLRIKWLDDPSWLKDLP